MTTLIRRLGKGYCAAGDGFYCFDRDLSRVLERVAEFTQRLDCEATSKGPSERQTETAGERCEPAAS